MKKGLKNRIDDISSLKKFLFQVIKRKPNLLLLKKNWFIITKVVIILKKKL